MSVFTNSQFEFWLDEATLINDEDENETTLLKIPLQ